MEHVAGFYKVKVGVCKSDRIVCDPIGRVLECYARLVDGREIIYPPGYRGGLNPGVRRGGMWVISPKAARPVISN